MAAKTQEKNQTEEEFFAIATVGRNGVKDMLAVMGPELHKIAAANVIDNFDVWKTRALVEIASSDALKPIIATRTGLLSIYQGLTKAATAGLQIGGQTPQVYFVPKAGKAVMIPTKEGYSQIATYGPGAVLREYPELHRVYEKDKFRIDDAARTYDHKFEPFAERGKLLGYFTVLEYHDGRKAIPYILQDKVRDIQKAYKMSDGPAWKKSPDEMDEKTAMKYLLREPVRESVGRAMMVSLDVEYEEVAPVEPETRNVTERTSERLADATEALDPENAVEPEESPDPEAGKEGKDGETPTEGEKKGPDLF